MAEYSDSAAKTPSEDDKALLDQARNHLKEYFDDNAEELRKQLDDLRFATLDQWPPEIRAARENDAVNGARPCLTIDQINQYVVQVVNDGKQNRPAIKTRPVDSGSDIETADILQGVIRQIEDQSQADVAYATALESAVKIGEGYFRVITEYEHERTRKQVIRIKRIPDRFCVALGPHVMPDGSDAEWGFIFEDLPKDRFKRLYPRAKCAPADFDTIPAAYNEHWGDSDKIRVAEYFYFKYTPATLLFLTDGREMTEAEYEKLPEEGRPQIAVDEKGSPVTRETQIRTTHWCKLTGIEKLEARDWAGKHIPICKVIGKESWVAGRRHCWGLVRPAIDSLRMYNYVASTIVEKFMLAPKAPFIMADGQLEGHEEEWAQANTANKAVLTYKAQTVDGLSVPAPQRQQPAPIEAALYQFMAVAREDVQASLGMFKAALGKEQPQQSGKAILALTRESDTGTFHFSDNQRLAIQYCGRILVDLIPKVMDTKQIVRILGEDGKMTTAEIDPNQSVAKREVREGAGIRKIYNLGVGTYDVTVTVGPSFNTKRMESAALFTDLANSAKDPVSAAVVRYLAVKQSDFSGAQQAADMLEKLLPPQVMPAKDGQPQIPPQVAQQMQQMGQQLQLLGQENQELKSGAQEANAKIQTAHKEKMAQLALDKEAQDEEQRLERERFEFQKRLDIDKANAAQDLKEREAAAANDQQTKKLDFERQCRMEEAKKDAGAENEVAAEKIAPQLVETMRGIVDEFSKATSAQQELNEKLVAELAKPKTVTIGGIQRGPQGLTGAKATVN